MAAAVRGPEGPVAAISLVGDARTPLERVAPLVVDAARTVTAALFPSLRIESQPAGPGRRAARRAGRHSSGQAEGSWSPRTIDRMLAATEYGDWF